MKRYAVVHTTRYTYGQTVDLGLHTARLSPAGNGRQRLVDHAIDVSPHPAWVVAFTDHFGNGMHHIAIETAHQELVVTQRTAIDIMPALTDVPPGPAWETVRDGMQADSFPEHAGVAEFIYASPLAPMDDAATAYAREVFMDGAPLVTALLDLTKRFKADFTYAPGATSISTPVSEIMCKRHGVCQDFTHAMISGLRGLGLPARYVSGYLKTYAAPPPDAAQTQSQTQDGQTQTQTTEPAAPQPEAAPLVGADATHAWVSAWCGPEIGWLEFDPTNALLVGDEHIAVAYGRDFNDVTPLRGVIMGGGSHTLQVAVKVECLSDVQTA